MRPDRKTYPCKPLVGEGQDEGSWVAAALPYTPSPCPSPARGEGTQERSLHTNANRYKAFRQCLGLLSLSRVREREPEAERRVKPLKVGLVHSRAARRGAVVACQRRKR